MFAVVHDVMAYESYSSCIMNGDIPPILVYVVIQFPKKPSVSVIFWEAFLLHGPSI